MLASPHMQLAELCNVRQDLSCECRLASPHMRLTGLRDIRQDLSASGCWHLPTCHWLGCVTSGQAGLQVDASVSPLGGETCVVMFPSRVMLVHIILQVEKSHILLCILRV